MRRGALAMLMMALLGAPPKLRADDAAQPVRVEVRGLARTSCLTALELRRRVEQRSGSLAPAAGTPGRQVVVTFASAGREGLEVRIVLRDGHGSVLGERRLIERVDCRAFDEAVVLIVATFFGRDVVPDSAEPAAPAPEEPPSAAFEPPPAAPARVEEAGGAALRQRAEPSASNRTEVEPLAWRTVLGAGLATGLTPRPSAGPSLGLVAEGRLFSLSAEAGALPRARQSLRDGASARYHAVWLRLLPCLRAKRWTAARLGLCAGLRVGALWVATRGLAFDEAQGAALVDTDLGARLRFGGDRQGHASLAVTLPLRATAFSLRERDGTSTVYHRTGVGLWLGLGFYLGSGS